MDHVFAKVKRLTRKPFFKLISDYTLYEDTKIKLAACVPYAVDHNLDEDTWFKVEKFSQQKFCIGLLQSDFDSKDYDDIKKEHFPKISYIFAVQDGDFFFQKITASLFIKKKMIGFGEAAEIEECSNRLVINDQPDAIYFKNEDTIIFRDLAAVSAIFRGIDSLYREATQQETEIFLQTEFVILKNNYDATKVSRPNRKRIALAVDSLAKMSAQDKLDILAYIGDYCDQKLRFDQKLKKFEISTDEDLKLLLYGIQQRFYTTLFGQEKRLANSVQQLG